MAAFNYAAVKNLASQIIANFGTTGVLVKPGAAAGTGDSWNADAAAPTEIPVKVLMIDYTKRDMDLFVSIQAHDRRALISTSGLSVQPDASYRLRAEGREYDIISVEVISPGAVDLCYDAQVRR